jgi:hypothetical protein
MAKQTGTICSADQELFVPPNRHSPSRHGDTSMVHRENAGMTKQMSKDERGAVAFARFRELMADLELTEADAIALAFNLVGKEANIGKKAVEQWFKRGAIPPYLVFNLAFALGIDVNWLAGASSITKEKAVHKHGYYHTDRERVVRLKAELLGKQRRQAG